MTTLDEKIAVMQAAKRGEPIEVKFYKFAEWTSVEQPSWDWANHEYRVSPRKPTVDWSHVGDGVNAFVRDKDGTSFCCSRIPVIDSYDNTTWQDGGTYYDAGIFASFNPGNCDWKESLIIRPGYEDDKK